MTSIISARYSDAGSGGSSIVTIMKAGSSGDGRYVVSLSSLTDDDINVSYRFVTRVQADDCYAEECRRLVKMGMKESA